MFASKTENAPVCAVVVVGFKCFFFARNSSAATLHLPAQFSFKHSLQTALIPFWRQKPTNNNKTQTIKPTNQQTSAADNCMRESGYLSLSLITLSHSFKLSFPLKKNPSDCT